MVFQLWANYDVSNASPHDVAIVAAAGPVFSLAVGMAPLVVYLPSRQRGVGLLWLMLAAMNLALGVGNVFGVAFGSDGHTVAASMDFSRGEQAAASTVGCLALVGMMTWAGRELVKWAPPALGRLAAATWMVLVPAVGGTIATLVAYAPLPGPVAAAHLSELVFWAVALVAALTAKHRAMFPATSVAVADTGITLVAVIAVRLLTGGVHIPAL